MKCITYISQVAHFAGSSGVPSGFANIHQHARKANLAKGLSSIFSYKNGYYLQVIEGESKHVDKLFDKIKADKRHKNVTAIFETATNVRCFPHDSMRLIASLQKSASFNKFVKKYSLEISQIDDTKKHLLEHFFDLPCKHLTDSRYKDKYLSLTAWPDFNRFPINPSLIELCASLTSSPQSYNSLSEGRDFWSQIELNGALDKLNALGILDVIRPKQTMRHTPNIKSENGVFGFYHKLRRLLSVAA